MSSAPREGRSDVGSCGSTWGSEGAGRSSGVLKREGPRQEVCPQAAVTRSGAPAASCCRVRAASPVLDSRSLFSASCPISPLPADRIDHPFALCVDGSPTPPTRKYAHRLSLVPWGPLCRPVRTVPGFQSSLLSFHRRRSLSPFRLVPLILSPTSVSISETSDRCDFTVLLYSFVFLNTFFLFVSGSLFLASCSRALVDASSTVSFPSLRPPPPLPLVLRYTLTLPRHV